MRLSYYISTAFYRPLSVLGELKEDGRNTRTGWILTAGFTTLYALTALLLGLNHRERICSFSTADRIQG